MEKKILKKYKVKRDSREKSGYWEFPESSCCLGTVEDTISTGDYTLENLEDILAIERKASTGEFSGNISEARFFRELDRLNKFKYAYLILEFTMEDLYLFPLKSGIPSRYWPKLRVSAGFLIKKLIEIETTYTNIHVVFAGDYGPQIAEAIFKKVNQLYGSNS